jgi:transcriptional regulator with XRE-family HTH domain
MRATVLNAVMRRQWMESRYVTRSDFVVFGMQVLGQSIDRALRERMMTQAKLAGLAGLHPSTISKLVNGRLQGMRLYTLARVVAALNIGIDLLEPGVPRATWLTDPIAEDLPDADDAAHP